MQPPCLTCEQQQKLAKQQIHSDFQGLLSVPAVLQQYKAQLQEKVALVSWKQDSLGSESDKLGSLVALTFAVLVLLMFILDIQSSRVLFYCKLVPVLITKPLKLSNSKIRKLQSYTCSHLKQKYFFSSGYTSDL